MSAGKTFAKKCRVICEIIKSYCCFRTAGTLEALESESGLHSPHLILLKFATFFNCHMRRMRDKLIVNKRRACAAHTLSALRYRHTHTCIRIRIPIRMYNWLTSKDRQWVCMCATRHSLAPATRLPRQLFNQPHQQSCVWLPIWPRSCSLWFAAFAFAVHR